MDNITPNQAIPDWQIRLNQTNEILKRCAELSRYNFKQLAILDRQVKETGRQMKETDRQMKETDRKFKELAENFTSQVGHLIEGLVEPEAHRVFRKAGFNIEGSLQQAKKKRNGKEMEADLILFGDECTIVVETKLNCTDKKIDHFLNQMEIYRDLFGDLPFTKSKVYAAIAAVRFEAQSDKYAQEHGLMVIRAKENKLFTLDKVKPEDLRLF